ncbi:hypothetical protein M409DRAFT_51674 [Zasmidium cellare ATCC 36951]|uniref:Uncharacterized protein n=1 Tax=Zasmidium cellare ATCC 36951 TaxID=1080233 RepID=A0A6A6CUA5_ZASCE|nr:uncharacterized protein M409DRAFT_51674 [Zasmidium cellare ATCC 36951]KAF2170671.1 hypothetical protein M409DRAFT_51674 [Zasmidium cellare ATCC 36951]
MIAFAEGRSRETFEPVAQAFRHTKHSNLNNTTGTKVSRLQLSRNMSSVTAGPKRPRVNSLDPDLSAIDQPTVPKIEAVIGHCFKPDSEVVQTFSSLYDAHFVRYEVKWIGCRFTTCETWWVANNLATHTLFEWEGLDAIDAYWLRMSQDPRHDAEETWTKSTSKMRALEHTPTDDAYFKSLPEGVQQGFPMAWCNRPAPHVSQTLALLRSSVATAGVNNGKDHRVCPSANQGPKNQGPNDPANQGPNDPTNRGSSNRLSNDVDGDGSGDTELESSEAESSGKEIDWNDADAKRRKLNRQCSRKKRKWLSHRPDLLYAHRQQRNKTWNKWVAKNPDRYGEIYKRKRQTEVSRLAAARRALQNDADVSEPQDGSSDAE